MLVGCLHYTSFISLRQPRSSQPLVFLAVQGLRRLPDSLPTVPYPLGVFIRMYYLASEDYAIFESALPCVGWTVLLNGLSQMELFQFFRPGGDGVGSTGTLVQAILIHPPRAGWDYDAGGASQPYWRISIHPPRAGWDSRSDRGLDANRWSLLTKGT